MQTLEFDDFVTVDALELVLVRLEPVGNGSHAVTGKEVKDGYVLRIGLSAECCGIAGNSGAFVGDCRVAKFQIVIWRMRSNSVLVKSSLVGSTDPGAIETTVRTRPIADSIPAILMPGPAAECFSNSVVGTVGSMPMTAATSPGYRLA